MEFEIQTNQREELIDITPLIEDKLIGLKIEKGVLHIYAPHATAGITINENADPNLPKDIRSFLNKLVSKGIWMHDNIDNNADAHIKASLIGNSVSIPIRDRKLKLGTWQDIFLCEFDGPRKRRIILTVLNSL